MIACSSDSYVALQVNSHVSTEASSNIRSIPDLYRLQESGQMGLDNLNHWQVRHSTHNLANRRPNTLWQPWIRISILGVQALVIDFAIRTAPHVESRGMFWIVGGFAVENPMYDVTV